MRFAKIWAVLSLAVVLSACRDAAVPVRPDGPDALGPQGQFASSRYVVVFRDHVVDPAGLAATLTATLGGNLLYTYTAGDPQYGYGRVNARRAVGGTP